MRRAVWAIAKVSQLVLCECQGVCNDCRAKNSLLGWRRRNMPLLAILVKLKGRQLWGKTATWLTVCSLWYYINTEVTDRQMWQKEKLPCLHKLYHCFVNFKKAFDTVFVLAAAGAARTRRIREHPHIVSSLCMHMIAQQYGDCKDALPSPDTWWASGQGVCRVSLCFNCMLISWKGICWELLTMMRLPSGGSMCPCCCLLMSSSWCSPVQQDFGSNWMLWQVSVISLQSIWANALWSLA